MRVALALSVLLHVLLLSIPMQGDVFGLSALRFPWEERRLAASDLQIVLAPAAPAAPAPPAAIPSPPAPPSPSTSRTPAPAAVAPRVKPPEDVVPKPPAAPKEAVVASVTPEPTRQADERPAEVDLIALAREQAEREASARVEAERVAAHRREQERKAQLEAERREQEVAAQREAARQEEIQQELARQEQARQEQVRQEQVRQEQARQEQARQEQARQEQARLEEAQREQERARQAQASQSSVQQGPAQAGQLAPRAERLRAIAEQLAREAAGRERTDSPSGAPQPTVSGLRRGWLFGRADPNQDLVQYAQAMGRKIELNRTLDMVREAVRQPHTQPVVTVAVRADGSVEKITFETSSGVSAIDEGIRKIIASQAPFGPFPPALARQYDVVEIRRTWLFDVAVRLQ